MFCLACQGQIDELAVHWCIRACLLKVAFVRIAQHGKVVFKKIHFLNTYHTTSVTDLRRNCDKTPPLKYSDQKMALIALRLMIVIGAVSTTRQSRENLAGQGLFCVVVASYVVVIVVVVVVAMN